MERQLDTLAGSCCRNRWRTRLTFLMVRRPGTGGRTGWPRHAIKFKDGTEVATDLVVMAVAYAQHRTR